MSIKVQEYLLHFVLYNKEVKKWENQKNTLEEVH